MIDQRLYMLDTNTVSYILDDRSPAARAMLKTALAQGRVTISTIIEAELLYGVERKAGSKNLRLAVAAFLATVEVMPWDSLAAAAYAQLKIQLRSKDKTLDAYDMLIAAHAAAEGATLVTHDKAFAHAAPTLTVTDWATDL